MIILQQRNIPYLDPIRNGPLRFIIFSRKRCPAIRFIFLYDKIVRDGYTYVQIEFFINQCSK